MCFWINLIKTTEKKRFDDAMRKICQDKRIISGWQVTWNFKTICVDHCNTHDMR